MKKKIRIFKYKTKILDFKIKIIIKLYFRNISNASETKYQCVIFLLKIFIFSNLLKIKKLLGNMKVFLCIIFLFFFVAHSKPSHCPPCDKGSTVEELNDYKKKVDNVLKELEEISKLHKECLNKQFIVLTAVEFSEGFFSFTREEFVNYERFFQLIKDLQICGTEHLLPDSWPSERELPDLKPIFQKLKEKNPVLYSDQLYAWSSTLSLFKSYLTQCTSKSQPLDHAFFNKFGPGMDIVNVTFTPKSRSNNAFSFRHRFLPELSGYTEDRKIATDAFNDALKYIEAHFVPRFFVPTGESTQGNSLQSDPVGFQLLWTKGNNPFKVLHGLKLRGNINGYLTVYVFDGNGRLKEVESSYKRIKTEGEAVISLSDFNVDLNDKDIVLFDVDGEGGLSHGGSGESTIGKAITNNLVLINKSIPRYRFKNPKVGQNFEVQNTETGVVVVLELMRKEEGGKRRSPVVNVEAEKKEHTEL